MATVTLVEAQELEDNDLINLDSCGQVLNVQGFDTFDPDEDPFVKVDGQPEDVDTFNVRVYTNFGSFVVERTARFEYGGVYDPDAE
jgi:hypothetical protein